MKILFLNVWSGRQTQNLTEFLALHAHDTDVLCLQEATAQFDALQNELFQDFTSSVLRKPHLDEEFVLKTLSRTAAAQTRSLWEDSALGAALYTRIDTSAAPLHIVNVHGQPHPGKYDTPERIEQSRILIDFLKDKDGVQIVGGDFNIMPETTSAKMFRDAGFRDLINNYNIKTTRNRLAWERYPGQELAYSDYVFVRGADVVSFEVPPGEMSDHLPMILTIAPTHKTFGTIEDNDRTQTPAPSLR